LFSYLQFYLPPFLPYKFKIAKAQNLNEGRGGGEENGRTLQDEGGQPILFLLNRLFLIKLNLHLMVPKSSILADIEKPFVGCPEVTYISGI